MHATPVGHCAPLVHGPQLPEAQTSPLGHCELVVHGPPEACRERIAEYRDQGLDTPVVAIVPVPGVEPAAMVPRLAPR